MHKPILTIGMACHDDFEGTYFTVQSLMMHHREAMADCEIVVIDNNPSSDQGGKVKSFILNSVPNGRYIPFTGVTGTAMPKNRLFIEAFADAVLCIDSHVMLASGAITNLVNFYMANPDTLDLFHGPLTSDDQSTLFTHMEPVWNSEFFGTWGSDQNLLEMHSGPMDIVMHGCGLFTCRRNAWLGFNASFRGFGGEEGYIQQKFRNSGRKVKLLPFLCWAHRFTRGQTISYPLTRIDKVRNYLIGWHELGWPLDSIITAFSSNMTQQELQQAIDQSGIDINGVSSVADSVNNSFVHAH